MSEEKEATLKDLIDAIEPLLVRSDKDDEMQLRGILMAALTKVDERLAKLEVGEETAGDSVDPISELRTRIGIMETNQNTFAGQMKALQGEVKKLAYEQTRKPLSEKGKKNGKEEER
jgi:hypothetical protein